MSRHVHYALALCAFVAARRAHAEDPPLPLPPPHVHWERDQQAVDEALFSMLGLWVINAWVAGISDLVCSAQSCTDHAYDLIYLPLAGPAIAAAFPSVERAGGVWPVILVADSTLQVGSALVALFLYAIPTKRSVSDPSLASSKWMITPGARGAPLGVTFSLTAF